MAIFTYDGGSGTGASSANRYGRPLTAGTQGVLSSTTPLTIGVQGILEPVFIPILDSGIAFGGVADTVYSFSYASVDEPLVFNGAAQAIYIPSEEPVFNHTAEGGVLFDGSSTAAGPQSITITADGGIVFDGSADVSTVGIDFRGGKGTPGAGRPKKLFAHKEIFIHTAVPLREHYYLNTPYGKVRKGHGVLRLGGTSSSYFIPPKYLLIPDLPKVPKPEPRDTEFLRLYADLANRGTLRPKPQKQVFSYTAGTNQFINLSGESNVGYLDYGEVIITADDEMMLMGMLDSVDDAYISTVFDNKLKRQKGDDDELIELGIL